MSDMDINTVLDYIPQRYPFILVDRIIECEPGKRLVAIKNVSMNEPYFQGHFPGRPVMPGVLMLEALAQACILLAKKSTTDPVDVGLLHFLAGIDNARFKLIVLPGDQLKLEVELIKNRRDLWKLHGEASVDGKLACSADLMCVARDIPESDR